MEVQNQLCSFLFLFSLLILTGVEANLATKKHHGHHHHLHHDEDLSGFRPEKLFVFGDSYADTGNHVPPTSSWEVPYGITFPGRPSGRYSDGRVFTDFLARYLGLKTPVPYRRIKHAGTRLRYGVNFAYGGTGVFQTLFPGPNMTTQIDYFEQAINSSVYTKTDLDNSLALVSLSGNDYGAYTGRGGSPQGLPAFITTVVNQLAINLKRIHDLGVRRVAVASLAPLGCLPQSTIASSYEQCNAGQNVAVNFHNLLLKQIVASFNNGTNDSSFIILDLFDAFSTVLNNTREHPGSLRFKNPLRPCCMGKSSQYFCGNVNDKGEKMYTLCEDRRSTFFWDTVHPTQAGWNAVYSALQTSLEQIHYSI